MPPTAVSGGWRLHGALLLVALSFGGFHVVGKATLRELPPGVLVTVRLLGGAFLLQIIRLWRAIPGSQFAPWDVFRLLGLSLLGTVASQFFYLYGLSLSSAGSASILVTTIPVFTPLAAWMLRQEKLQGRWMLGVAAAFAGALLLLTSDLRQLAQTPKVLPGDFLLLASCMAYSLYLVLSRPLAQRLDPLTMTVWIFLTGGLISLPLGIVQWRRLELSQIDPMAWLGLAYAVIFATVIAYGLSIWALRRTSSTVVALYAYVQPLIALALASIFLGESATLMDVGAAALIFTGVFLASR